MKRTALKRKTPLRRMSKRRQSEYREYMKLRELFLWRHPRCQLWLLEHQVDERDPYQMIIAIANGCPLSTEIHHVNGRNGKNYLDTSTWLAVCRESHERIEQNKSWARANGYLGKK